MRSRTGLAATAALAAITVTAVAACASGGGSSSSSSTTTPSATTATSSSSNPLSQGSASGTVVVGSGNFPESELLAEIYILALQGKGIKVTPKLNIGSREVYYPQVQKGTVSIIPEYNGTLLSVVVDPTSTAKTTAAVDAALAAKLPSSLEILNPASAQDSDGDRGDRGEVPPEDDRGPGALRQELDARRPAGVQDPL
jgi:osmoprotectant transport system substrate-binding protein